MERVEELGETGAGEGDMTADDATGDDDACRRNCSPAPPAAELQLSYGLFVEAIENGKQTKKR